MFFQIIVNVLVDDLTVNTVLLLQGGERQQSITGKFPGCHLLLGFYHGCKLLALLFEPIVALLGEWPGDMLHVVGIIDFIRADVALGGHALVSAEPYKRRKHQRCAVEKQQLAGFFLIDRSGVRLVPPAEDKSAL